MKTKSISHFSFLTLKPFPQLKKSCYNFFRHSLLLHSAPRIRKLEKW